MRRVILVSKLVGRSFDWILMSLLPSESNAAYPENPLNSSYLTRQEGR